MKIKTIVAVSAMALVSVAYAVTDAEYKGVKYATGDVVTIGEWTSRFTLAKQFAEENDLPLVVFWGNRDCPHCQATEKEMATSTFVNWQKDSGLVFSFNIGKVTDNAEQNKAYSFAYAGTSYPFLRVYWKGHMLTGVGKESKGFMMPDKKAQYVIDTISRLLVDYVPNKGGSFAVAESPDHRYEIEKLPATVEVSLVRPASSAAFEATNKLKVLSPAGATLAECDVSWSASGDDTNQTVSVTIPAGALSVGEQAALVLDGKTAEALHVAYVASENSAANPSWDGEAFGFGDWTMDLEGAKALGATGNGTLVIIQGSKWCSDCANTETNFLGLAAPAGRSAGAETTNRFRNWAKANSLALAVVDVPNYTDEGDGAFTGSSLLHDTGTAGRSGLGYLTRKGISAEAAEAKRNMFAQLVGTDISAGGFHEAGDSKRFRTGVPVFVMLRPDGTPVARFTRFAAASPKTADQASFDNYLKRFDEMVAMAVGDHGDATELLNDGPENAVALASSGSVQGELCAADTVDYYELTDITGNASQAIAVTTDSDAEISVQCFMKGADGVLASVGNAVTASKTRPAELQREFKDAGSCYLKVSVKDPATGFFAPGNATANAFAAYVVQGKGAVYKPSESRAEGKVAAAGDLATVVLTEGETYRFDGLDVTDESVSGALTPASGDALEKYFTAKVSEDRPLKVAGTTFAYQIWHPGSIRFVESARTVPESVNDLNDDFVEIAVSRTDGVAGQVKARVSLDGEGTDLIASRYDFTATDLDWPDGIGTNQVVRIKIKDDKDYDGNQQLALKLEVLSSDNSDVVVGEGGGSFVLTVTENDRRDIGKAFVSGLDGIVVKGTTVYVREGESASVYAERTGGTDGLAGIELKSSIASATFATPDNERDSEVVGGKTILWWSHRESDRKRFTVSGLAAGTTAKITLNAYEGFTAEAKSNTVSVTTVAKDAPCFEETDVKTTVYRYVSVSNIYPVVNTTGGKLAFSKLEGALPPGLAAKYDAAVPGLVITGVPSATDKSGSRTYTAVFQVTETRGRVKVPGLLIRLTYDLVDPAIAGGAEGAAADVYYQTKRQYSSIPLFDTELGALAGVLDLTLPAKTGKASAKLLCAAGKVSFSAKGWGALDAEMGTYDIELTGTGAAKGATLIAKADQSGVLSGLEVRGLSGNYLAQDVKPATWTSASSAKSYQGTYTVSMPFKEIVEESAEGYASRGAPYLSLKMNGASDWNKGVMKWVGMLPNGQKVSGSATLTAKDGTATLPVMSASKKDVFSAYPAILENAFETVQNHVNGQDDDETCYQSITAPTVELAGEDVPVQPLWSHTEASKYTEYGDFAARYDLFGSIYSPEALKIGLDAASCEFVGTSNLFLNVSMPLLGSQVCVMDPVVGVPMVVGRNTLSVTAPTAENPNKVALKVDASGVVSGTFSVKAVENGKAKTVSAKFNGVVLIGWSSSCGCGTVDLPFINGSWSFSDKIGYPGARGATQYLTVVRGGEITSSVSTVD